MTDETPNPLEQNAMRAQRIWDSSVPPDVFRGYDDESISVIPSWVTETERDDEGNITRLVMTWPFASTGEDAP